MLTAIFHRPATFLVPCTYILQLYNGVLVVTIMQVSYILPEHTTGLYGLDGHVALLAASQPDDSSCPQSCIDHRELNNIWGDRLRAWVWVDR